MEDIFNTQTELQEELTDTHEIVEEEIDDLPPDDAVLPTENPAEEEESVEDTEESSENEIVSEEKEQKPKKEDKFSAYEKAVLAEMERRANEDNDTLVADALKSKDKNIHECWQYITAQAKKKAVSGCAMIEDAVVFGWAHHYYIEPKAVIDAELHPKPKTDTKATTPAKGAEKPKKPVNPKDAGKSNPLLQKVGKGKKNATQSNDKVYTKKVGDKTFTNTEFALF